MTYKQQPHNTPFWPPEFTFKWPAGDRMLAGDIQSIHDLDNVIFPMVPHKGVCIQAGGAMGMWAKRLAQVFGRVYTFEPTPQSFHCLNVNCPEENIIKMQAALGNKPCLVKMAYHEKPDNYGAYMAHPGGIIPTLTIDCLDLDQLDLLMLDIEGHELWALQGAANTIDKFKPVIVVEDKLPCLVKVGLKPGAVQQYLKDRHNYRTFERFHNNRDMICTP